MGNRSVISLDDNHIFQMMEGETRQSGYPGLSPDKQKELTDQRNIVGTDNLHSCSSH